MPRLEITPQEKAHHIAMLARTNNVRASVPADVKITTWRERGMTVAREIAVRRGVPIEICLGERKSDRKCSEAKDLGAMNETAYELRRRLNWSWSRIADILDRRDRKSVQSAANKHARVHGLPILRPDLDWHRTAKRMRAEGKAIGEIGRATGKDWASVAWALDENRYRDRVRKTARRRRLAHEIGQQP